MQIWPAIDLRGGKCVRLQQGDYDRETVFSEDPVRVAESFQAEGAKHLHLVDLDGAREGRPVNTDVIDRVVEAVDMECELGGGVRDTPTVETLLGLGLHRLVVGTSALKNPEWFAEICRAHPGRIVLGLDARDGSLATDGWEQDSGADAVQVARQLQSLPLAAIVYTDIATDGMLAGPNVPAMSAMQAAVDVPVVASGGVTEPDDVAALAAAGLAGAIIGRALYEGRISLASALELASDSEASSQTQT
ncbi:MAG: 1-(5-phosphoribosyl)-5-[(5-phosphoribosylamino)methylideneamino]imidazole-4-carboxamide isomerase [Acidobacteriota bacterium]